MSRKNLPKAIRRTADDMSWAGAAPAAKTPAPARTTELSVVTGGKPAAADTDAGAAVIEERAAAETVTAVAADAPAHPAPAAGPGVAQRRSAAHAIVERHVKYSALGGAIPMPIGQFREHDGRHRAHGETVEQSLRRAVRPSPSSGRQSITGLTCVTWQHATHGLLRTSPAVGDSTSHRPASSVGVCGVLAGVGRLHPLDRQDVRRPFRAGRYAAGFPGWSGEMASRDVPRADRGWTISRQSLVVAMRWRARVPRKSRHGHCAGRCTTTSCRILMAAREFENWTVPPGREQVRDLLEHRSRVGQVFERLVGRDQVELGLWPPAELRREWIIGLDMRKAGAAQQVRQNSRCRRRSRECAAARGPGRTALRCCLH